MTTTTEQGTPPREEPDASPVWSREDDERLSLAVARLGHSWEAVAQQLESRFTAEQCSSRWTRSLQKHLRNLLIFSKWSGSVDGISTLACTAIGEIR